MCVFIDPTLVPFVFLSGPPVEVVADVQEDTTVIKWKTWPGQRKPLLS